MSYTTFAYSELALDKNSVSDRDTLRISVRVTNTGPFTGDEVVQLYTRTPVASVTRPVKELRDFKRITLAPGEAATVEFMLHPSQLRFYNRDMNYVVEPGKIKIFVGTNSRDVLESEFDLR